MSNRALKLGVLILLLSGLGLMGAENAAAAEADAAADTGIFQNALDKTSYAIGMSMARSLTQQKIELNIQVMVQAIKDVMGKKELLLSSEDFQKTMQTFSLAQREKQQAARDAQSAKQAQDAPKNLAAATAFLEANKAKEGVKVTASGLQYLVMKAGTGLKPKPTDKVSVHYHGTLIDGTVFDSSVTRGTPAQFGVTQVIKGWIEALQLMETGAKWKLFIPPNLAYGPSGRPSIPPNSALIFEVELLAIVSK